MAVQPAGWVPTKTNTVATVRPDDTMLSYDMREHYRLASSQAYVMYNKRRKEVLPDGITPNGRALGLAKTANSAITSLKRGAYKEWVERTNGLLEKIAKYEGSSAIPTLDDPELNVDLLDHAYKYLSAEDLKAIAELVTEILGKSWMISLMYREFVREVG